MSFSNQVKEELASTISNPKHCRIAELAALVTFCGAYSYDNSIINLRSENELTIAKASQLVHKLLATEGRVTAEPSRQHVSKLVYTLELTEEETGALQKLVKSQIIHKENIVDNSKQIDDNNTVTTDKSVYRQSCCKRSYLRGAFLAAGSITDPKKDYHLELVTTDARQAGTLIDIISSFDIEAKVIVRKKYHVVYIKDSEHIVDFLNIIEAHVALMELENIRILKDMRNSVNRRVNCEAANIGKTIAAAGKQIEDIKLIRDTLGLELLSPELQATAQLRLQYPDSSLSELGSLHDKPVGRSGVNHRLQRLSEIAEKLRDGKPVE